MKDYPLTQGNLQQFFSDVQKELAETPLLMIDTRNPNTGKWGMTRLWRAWMKTTGVFMASQGVTMPLMINAQGVEYGKRTFDHNDAHELFTKQWLGSDKDGTRLSWSKKGRDGMRPATKGERFHAMLRHQMWCIDKGVRLFMPNDSEFSTLDSEQNK